MSRLANANVTARVVAALVRAGMEKHQGGSHTIVAWPGGAPVTLPRHKLVKPVLLKKILQQCGLTEERFLGL